MRRVMIDNLEKSYFHIFLIFQTKLNRGSPDNFVVWVAKRQEALVKTFAQHSRRLNYSTTNERPLKWSPFLVISDFTKASCAYGTQTTKLSVLPNDLYFLVAAPPRCVLYHYHSNEIKQQPRLIASPLRDPLNSGANE